MGRRRGGRRRREGSKRKGMGWESGMGGDVEGEKGERMGGKGGMAIKGKLRPQGREIDAPGRCHSNYITTFETESIR
jgi:hypothetical protein